jgi:aminomethyltransferase
LPVFFLRIIKEVLDMTETHGGEPMKTPLYDAHIRAGARMIDFGGWIMPVYYRGIVEEHKKVRQEVGLFDLCHMGEVRISGPRALEFLQKVTSNDVSTLVAGQAQYTLLCYPDGGIVDDILACRTEDGYYLVLNASNADKDIDWLRSHAEDGVEIKDESPETALLAIQGPDSAALLAQLTETDLDKVYYYQFTSGRVADVDCLISRTGYTGEDGFELFFDHTHAEKLWDALLRAGSKFNIEPIGLGARDTLRLEMGYSLYGNELDSKTNPLEVGLGWIVSRTKGDFVGKDSIERVRKEGISRRLTGFKLLERGVPRTGFQVEKDGKVVGAVTSGSLSPTLGIGIGMCFGPPELAKPGNQFHIVIRGKKILAESVRPPFVEAKVRKAK